MTYFAFLGLFLVVPISAALIYFAARRKGSGLPPRLTALRPIAAIAITALVAVIYTTPWDNYLVASGVWGYPRSQVSGVILGYVPLEEYLFFVLQTVLTSLGLIWVAGRSRRAESGPPARLRLWAALPLLMLWVIACAALAGPWGPWRYSVLLLAWALPPILIQVIFGADCAMAGAARTEAPAAATPPTEALVRNERLSMQYSSTVLPRFASPSGGRD